MKTVSEKDFNSLKEDYEELFALAKILKKGRNFINIMSFIYGFLIASFIYILVNYFN